MVKEHHIFLTKFKVCFEEIQIFNFSYFLNNKLCEQNVDARYYDINAGPGVSQCYFFRMDIHCFSVFKTVDK